MTMGVGIGYAFGHSDGVLLFVFSMIPIDWQIMSVITRDWVDTDIPVGLHRLSRVPSWCS